MAGYDFSRNRPLSDNYWNTACTKLQLRSVWGLRIRTEQAFSGRKPPQYGSRCSLDRPLARGAF